MVDECMEWVPYFQAKPKVANSFFLDGLQETYFQMEIYVEVGWVRARQVYTLKLV